MGAAKVEKISRYEILDVIGVSMGVVYKARDTTLGRLVAIKEMKRNCDNSYTQRFIREAQSTAKLQHKNIVCVHDFGEDDGTPFLVMEYLPGQNLEDIIKKPLRQVPLIEKLDYIIQACDGLQFAHDRAVVHRDIKPSNLMVSDFGQVKIVDFGIAHIADENMTLEGEFIGTPNYMSPEQFNCSHVDCRTDIFSTGVVLYQLLTNVLPFEGKDRCSIRFKVINEPPPSLQKFLRDYWADLDKIMEHALAKDPCHRYQTAGDLGSSLFKLQEKIKNDSLEVARGKIRHSEFDEAERIARSIIKIDHQNTLANEILAEIQRLKGDPDGTLIAAPEDIRCPLSKTKEGWPGTPTKEIKIERIAINVPDRADDPVPRNWWKIVRVPLSLLIIVALAALAVSVVVAAPRESRLSDPAGDMVLVPGGSFIFGADVPGSPHRKETRFLPTFYIDETEVSNASYKQFCADTHRTCLKIVYESSPDLPATGVSFDDASDFAKWAGKRLPTEEEWEKAARGSDGRIYPWGNSEWAGEVPNELQPVHSPGNGPSPVHALNMAGNAFEWTATLYQPTPEELETARQMAGPAATQSDWHVTKGGSFVGKPDKLLWFPSYMRSGSPSGLHLKQLGFRCVRYAKPVGLIRTIRERLKP